MKLFRQLALICVALAAYSVSFAQTEPNSFINRLCNSTGDLVRHARNDSKVMDRYMRHYAMSRDEVIDYLSSLKLRTTTEDQLLVVYAAPDDTPLRSKVLKVKKGTKVFVNSAGQIELLWHCGNPVTRGPKNPISSAQVGAEPEGNPNQDLRLVPTTSPSTMIQASTPTDLEPTVPVIPAVPVESDIPIVPSASIPGWLGLIPAIAVITNTHSNNPPVPEPATMIALGAGAIAVASRRRKK